MESSIKNEGLNGVEKKKKLFQTLINEIQRRKMTTFTYAVLVIIFTFIFFFVCDCSCVRCYLSHNSHRTYERYVILSSAMNFSVTVSN